METQARGAKGECVIAATKNGLGRDGIWMLFSMVGSLFAFGHVLSRGYWFGPTLKDELQNRSVRVGLVLIAIGLVGFTISFVIHGSMDFKNA